MEERKGGRGIEEREAELGFFGGGGGLFCFLFFEIL